MDAQIVATHEFEWKLSNFTLDLVKANKTVWSERFSIFLGMDETKWLFYFDVKNGSGGLYLYFAGSEVDDFTVNCNVFIKESNSVKYLNRNFVRRNNEFKSCRRIGWNGYVNIANICQNASIFLKDETLTLSLKIELTKNKEPLEQQSQDEFRKLCINCFENKPYADFKIICSDRVEIPVHRFVLAGFSPVMKAIFDSNMIESKTNTLEINDIDSKTMIEILRYTYTREVRNLKELAVKILYGAEKYQLLKLKKLCVTSMIENLSVGNALDYFVLGDQYNMKILTEKSAMFIKSHHEEVFKDIKKIEKLSGKLMIVLLDLYRKNLDDVKIFKSSL